MTRHRSISSSTHSITAFEDALGQAHSLAQVLMLTGRGMKAIDIEQGDAVIVVSDALLSVLATAKSDWRKVMAGNRR